MEMEAGVASTGLVCSHAARAEVEARAASAGLLLHAGRTRQGQRALAGCVAGEQRPSCWREKERRTMRGEKAAAGVAAGERRPACLREQEIGQRQRRKRAARNIWQLGRRRTQGSRSGVIGYGAELAATAPAQPHDKQLDAMTHGAETCYLSAMVGGADPLDPETQFIF